jgi:hypothetical protein
MYFDISRDLSFINFALALKLQKAKGKL